MWNQSTVAAIAAAQHGLITWWQLLEAGLSRAAISRLVSDRVLFRVYRGVYRVGHAAPSRDARYLAAVLAAGEGAALAGAAAAHLWELVRGAPPEPEVVCARRLRIKGLRTHQVQLIHATTLNNIRVTTPAATLAALAESFDQPHLARAVHEASVKYRTQPEDIEHVLDARPNTPGATTLRRIIRGDVHLTLSRLEQKFLSLLKASRLELPKTNKRIDNRYVDCRWPERKLTVELDSYRYHATRHAWEQDRKREREARARGDDFRRYTTTDVFDDPRALLTELRPLLR
jgi:very-short-patch-repair endonuclease